MNAKQTVSWPRWAIACMTFLTIQIGAFAIPGLSTEAALCAFGPGCAAFMTVMVIPRPTIKFRLPTRAYRGLTEEA